MAMLKIAKLKCSKIGQVQNIRNKTQRKYYALQYIITIAAIESVVISLIIMWIHKEEKNKTKYYLIYKMLCATAHRK